MMPQLGISAGSVGNGEVKGASGTARGTLWHWEHLKQPYPQPYTQSEPNYGPIAINRELPYPNRYEIEDETLFDCRRLSQTPLGPDVSDELIFQSAVLSPISVDKIPISHLP